jgi:hypothetical protein
MNDFGVLRYVRTAIGAVLSHGSEAVGLFLGVKSRKYAEYGDESSTGEGGLSSFCGSCLSLPG